MAQFTPTGLARLLANVEREILVEALEIADLTQLLPARHLAILDDVQGNWNTVFNVFLSGDIERATSAAAAAAKKTRKTGVLAVDSVIASLQVADAIFDPTGIVGRMALQVQDLLGLVSGFPIPELPPKDDVFDPAVAELAAVKIIGLIIHIQQHNKIILENVLLTNTFLADLREEGIDTVTRIDLLNEAENETENIDIDLGAIHSQINAIIESLGLNVPGGPVPPSH